MTHYGTVSAINGALEASITLTLRGDNGATELIPLIIDTGSTAEISLPNELIVRLNLPPADDADIAVTLADGVTNRFRLYVADILWHDRWREVEVVNLENDPLIGMDLLRGCNLSVDAAPGGLVTITELSIPS